MSIEASMIETKTGGLEEVLPFLAASDKEVRAGIWNRLIFSTEEAILVCVFTFFSFFC